MMTPLPTQLVLGRYALQGKLASGGMAEIWLARALGHDGFSKQVVVKRILPQLGADPEVEALFKSEARIAARLDHPNLLHVFDYGRESDGTLVLVMELVDGTSLRAVVRAVKAGHRLDPRVAAKLIALACEGLHAAHEQRDENGVPLGLIHRDISPENILLSRAGAVKVADFGIARVSDAPLTDPNVFRGKLGYAAPEQIQGTEFDRRIDLWAIGCTLFELLAGTGPFLADTQPELASATLHREPRVLSEVRKDCPLALSNLVAKCLEKDPARRWADAGELSAELERFISWSGDPIRSTELGALFTTLHIAPHTVTTQGTPQPWSASPTPLPAFAPVEPSTFQPRAELAANGVLHPLAPERPARGPEPVSAAANGVLHQHVPERPARAPEPVRAAADAVEPLAPTRAEMIESSLPAEPSLELEPLAVQVEPLAPTADEAPQPRRAGPMLKLIAASVALTVAALAAWSFGRPALQRATFTPGTLFIESVPSPARVLLNGQPVGETPWAGQTATETIIVLSREGYEPKTVRFEAGAEWSGTVTLAKKKK